MRKISYVGDWTSYSYRKAMEDAGYKDGDRLGGKNVSKTLAYKLKGMSKLNKKICTVNLVSL